MHQQISMALQTPGQHLALMTILRHIEVRGASINVTVAEKCFKTSMSRPRRRGESGFRRRVG